MTPTSTSNDEPDCILIDRMKREFRGMRLVQLLHERVRYERARDGELEHRLPPQFIRVTLLAIDECIVLGWNKSRASIDRFLEIARRHPSKPFVV